MPQFIIDTDTLSHYRSGHPVVRANFLKHPLHAITASVTSLEEQLSGWYGVLRSAKSTDQQVYAYQRLIDVVEFFQAISIVPHTRDSLHRYQSLLKLRLNIGGNDLRIGAIALETNAIMVTANLRDFGRIPGLILQDWTV